HHDTFVLLRRNGLVLGIKRAGALAATQVRHTHSGEHPSANGVRRESVEAMQNRSGSSHVAQQLPKRYSLAAINHAWRSEHALRPFESVEGVIRQMRLRIAAQKIENAMATGVRS